MNIYHIPNRKQQKEKVFFTYLIENLPNAVHIKEKFALPSELLTKTIKTGEIITSLRAIKGISDLKKNACLAELERLPEEIRILKSLDDISVDFIIEVNNKVYYIEFHEDQHRIDSNRRIKYIYDSENKPIAVPRYLQRLLRDIWRWKFLPNYQIVWFDWFRNNHIYPADKLLSEINYEHSLENKFRLSDI